MKHWFLVLIAGFLVATGGVTHDIIAAEFLGMVLIYGGAIGALLQTIPSYPPLTRANAWIFLVVGIISLVYGVAFMPTWGRLAGLGGLAALAGALGYLRPTLGTLVLTGMLVAALPARGVRFLVGGGEALAVPVVAEALKPVGGLALMLRWRDYIWSGRIPAIYGGLAGLGYGLIAPLLVAPAARKFLLGVAGALPLNCLLSALVAWGIFLGLKMRSVKPVLGCYFITVAVHAVYLLM